MTVQEMAAFFARQIKAGRITRKEAINEYCCWAKSSFVNALLAIDMAIGDLNEGLTV